MIPDFVNIGGPFGVLPPGIHEATLDEIRVRFATTKHRQSLFDGFKAGAEILQQAGCKIIFLDGSYVSEKVRPHDFDACWDPSGVDPNRLDPILLDFDNMRSNQRKRFRGELFFSIALADYQNCFLDFFQTDKYTGKRKGIIRLSLSQKKRHRVK